MLDAVPKVVGQQAASSSANEEAPPQTFDAAELMK